MVRKRLFLDVNVVEAARKRVEHVYDIFDTVAVQFSGGKDSTAVLYLAKEVHDKRALGPVKVIFRDEEMLSPAIVEFVEEVRNYDWVDMEWYCLPQAQEIWVLGRREYVLLWSAERAAQGRLIREMPSWAIRAEHFGLDPNVPIPESVDYYTMQGKRGQVAYLQGVRANESMTRYRSIVQKLHENYIVRPYRESKAMPLRFVKPVYDWTTDDILKFITEEHGAGYCKFYDYAALAGANPRVGIPLHSFAARRIKDVIATEPEFFDSLIRVFPHVDALRHIWRDFDIEGLIGSYAVDGWNGVRACIEDNMLSETIAQAARAFVAAYRKKHLSDPFAYPIDNLIRVLLLGDFDGVAPSPVGPKTRANTVRSIVSADVL